MLHQDSQLVELQPTASYDLLQAKLCPPVVRPGSVPRTALVNRLRVSGSSLVTVIAPAGYGKTTVLAQWASRDRRPFVWVSIDEDDNDAVTLSRYVASAMARVHCVDRALLDVLTSPEMSASAAIRRITSALFASPEPLVLVLDGVHFLRSRQCAHALSKLADHVPAGSTLVLAGRALPRLPIARVRTAGCLFEVGVEELALTRREVELLLRGVGIQLRAADVIELAERTEGWAVGTYLAALSLKEGTSKPGHSASVGGDDRFLADYFDFEHLSRLGEDDIRFLTRTAVLERMCGQLCDAVLESTGSAAKLDSIARSSVFLVSLDRRRTWYRYHHQFREFLRAELERREPELVAELNRRAAAWCEANDAEEAAIPHARAARDAACLARLVTALALPLCSAGRGAAVEDWLDWFDDEGRLDNYPTVCLVGSWAHLLRGRPAAATRWLNAAEKARVDGPLPDGSASLAPWIAVLRAAMCRDGAQQMREDADFAIRGLGVSSYWRPAAELLRGIAQLFLEEDDCGEESLAEAAETAEAMGAATLRVLALAERSLLAASRGDEAEAETMVAQARALIDEAQLGDDPITAIAFAASARHRVRRGDFVQARAELARAHALAGQLTEALPWYSVQTNLELGRADLALLDERAARMALSAADAGLRRRPRLGGLAAQLQALRAEVARAAELNEGRATSLTTAELRLLPLLTTHLSFREIAERLFVSRNTVKTQAISVYRKLAASSRSEAIARATELGLVGAATVPPRDDFIPSG